MAATETTLPALTMEGQTHTVAHFWCTHYKRLHPIPMLHEHTAKVTYPSNRPTVGYTADLMYTKGAVLIGKLPPHPQLRSHHGWCVVLQAAYWHKCSSDSGEGRERTCFACKFQELFHFNNLLQPPQRGCSIFFKQRTQGGPFLTRERMRGRGRGRGRGRKREREEEEGRRGRGGGRGRGRGRKRRSQ